MIYFWMRNEAIKRKSDSGKKVYDNTGPKKRQRGEGKKRALLPEGEFGVR